MSKRMVNYMMMLNKMCYTADWQDFFFAYRKKIHVALIECEK